MNQSLAFLSGTLVGLFLSWKISESWIVKIQDSENQTDSKGSDLHQHCQQKIAAERSGRIKAEKMIREQVVDKITLSGYPLVIIGKAQSPFKARRGTPRQGLLVNNSRSKIVLSMEMPTETLLGLEGYSHMFVIFLFHENTNLLKSLSGCNASSNKDSALRNRTTNGKSGNFTGKVASFAAKVLPPLLNGGSIGLFATRSPHRPNAIGMSLVQIISVCAESRTVIVAGADLVDGTPIIDLKPWGPFDCPTCLDKIVHSIDSSDVGSQNHTNHGTFKGSNQCDFFKTFVPDWVEHGIKNPYKLAVKWKKDAEESLRNMVENKKSGYYKENEADVLVDAISQMLGLDIRYSCSFSDFKEVFIRGMEKDQKLTEILL